MGALADARTQVSGFYDRARRGFGILVKKQRRARRLRRPETIQDSPRYRARDHPPLIIKSRGFLNPLRKRLCADPILYNVYKSSYDISRSKASAASRHGKHYNDFSVGRYVILPNHIHLLVGDSDASHRTVWTVGLARGRLASQGAGQKKRISRFGNGAFGIAKCGAIKPAM